MKFEEVWEEQQELNKIGQNINEKQAHRLYCYGYNQAVERFESYFIDKQRVREAVMRLPNDNRRYILLKELGLEDEE